MISRRRDRRALNRTSLDLPAIIEDRLRRGPFASVKSRDDDIPNLFLGAIPVYREKPAWDRNRRRLAAFTHTLVDDRLVSQLAVRADICGHQRHVVRSLFEIATIE